MHIPKPNSVFIIIQVIVLAYPSSIVNSLTGHCSLTCVT